MIEKINPKQIAGECAAGYVQSDTTVGLGTGSTAYYALKKLGERIAEGLSIRGVPTSQQSHDLAIEFGIPLTDFSAIEHIDLTIDGADEIDRDFNLTKGGGGALLREKIVAAATVREIIVGDESKMCQSLGAFPLPVEVTPFGWQATLGHLAALGCDPVLRMSAGKPFVTDNGGYILDCSFGASINDPRSLENDLLDIAGVVEVGLFVGICDAVVMATSGGVVTLLNESGRLG